MLPIIRSFSNPFGPDVELDDLELWVGNIDKVKQTLTSKFNFESREQDFEFRPDDEVKYLTCGNVRLTLRQGKTPKSIIASYVAKHGDSVTNVGLICNEVDAVVERALAYGLKVSQENGNSCLDLLGDGTILHTLRSRSTVPRLDASGQNHKLKIQAIDHVAYCLPIGMMDHVAQIYREVLGLKTVHIEEVRLQAGVNSKDSDEGMRSIALRSPLGFSVVLTEPLSSKSWGQTQEFLEEHAGPGVQHVAFAYSDLVATVEILKLKGVPFLSIPSDCLEVSHKRLCDCSLSLELLRHNEILVDSDRKGLLFQKFTLPISAQGNFFFELIQREGATGFGSANIRALYTAIDTSMRDPVNRLWKSPNKNSKEAEWADTLVQRARKQVPFYTHLLKDKSSSDLKSLPSFDKSMLGRYGRFPLSVGGAAGAQRILATSGTTGKRLYVAFDKEEWNRTACWLEKVGRRVGLIKEDVLLNTHCYGLWVGGPALDLLANRTGCGLVPLGPTSPENVLELIVDGVGTAISATPSYLRRLIETAKRMSIDLRETSLRFGFIGAEAAEESLRRKLLSLLPEDFKWIELYGLTETGGPSVAFAPNPDIAEMELNTCDFLVEVLDLKADRVVPIGEVGELSITTKRTDGRTPLIRYRTRDLVRATAGEPVAPTHISRILGRADESLKIGGILVYPSSVAEIMSEFMPPTAEWRALVHRREPDDELLIEAEVQQDLCDVIKLAFRERFSLDLKVISTQTGVLTRSRQKTQRILIDSSTISSPTQCTSGETQEESC